MTDLTERLRIRPATIDDVPAIVDMLADDPLGATRESPADLAPYLEAFERIAADPRQHLVIAERDGQPAGTLQLTMIYGLSRRGPLLRTAGLHKLARRLQAVPA